MHKIEATEEAQKVMNKIHEYKEYTRKLKDDNISSMMKAISARWRDMTPEEQFQIAMTLAGNRYCNIFINSMNKCAYTAPILDKNLIKAIYDNLYLIYKCARERQALYEMRDGVNIEYSRNMCERDVAQFRQILNELIEKYN